MERSGLLHHVVTTDNRQNTRLRIQYAKGKSDCIAKAVNTILRKEKRKKQEEKRWDLQEATENIAPTIPTVPGVKISNVVYKDVHGISTTQVVVVAKEARALKDVNLRYAGKPAISSCFFAVVTASGLLIPRKEDQEGNDSSEIETLMGESVIFNF
nr:polygalacturonase-like [Tanacetum cinerariifolium]